MKNSEREGEGQRERDSIKKKDSDGKERRSRVVVDEDIQLYHFSSLAVCMFVMMAAFSSILLFSGHQNIWRDWVALTALMIMFAIPPLFGIHSILHSHRIAGPIYHFHKALAELIRGHYRYRMVLREKDYFKTLEELYNQLATQLDNRRAMWSETLLELDEFRDQLADSEKEKFDDLRDRLDEIWPPVKEELKKNQKK